MCGQRTGSTIGRMQEMGEAWVKLWIGLNWVVLCCVAWKRFGCFLDAVVWFLAGSIEQCVWEDEDMRVGSRYLESLCIGDTRVERSFFDTDSCGVICFIHGYI